jgi:hypothetical protein
MEPFEKDELSDLELDRMLPQWSAPDAPARLKSAVFPERSGPWWRRLCSTSIRVPVPVLCGVMLVMAVMVAIRSARPVPPPAVVVKTERVEVPVIQERVVTRTVYRERPATMPLAWRPVRELRPRIIRSGNAQN